MTANGTFSRQDAMAALAWQLDLGADECIADAPVNRYDAPPPPKLPKMGTGSNIAPLGQSTATQAAPVMAAIEESAAEVAALLAKRATTLDALRNAMATFEHCALKKGARNLVFADGIPGARIMVVGEAPGRD
ncbi:MAG: uracil-DNA glycosylase, partial [Pseudomonadota bacterium]